MSRLFIAIDLPERVKDYLARMRVDIPGVRWVPDAQLHLTLAFLGDQDPEAIPRLKAGLSAIRNPGFRLRLSTPGCFPDRAHPKVLWVGIEPEAQLERLAAQVQRVLRSCAFAPEERPFSPHITLCRLKMPADHEASRFLNPPQPLKIPPVDVDAYGLYESRLTPGGAVHTLLELFPLSTGQALDDKPIARPPTDPPEQKNR